MTLTEQMTLLARQARAASRDLAKLSTAEKNLCLLAMAGALEQNKAVIQEANALDMKAGAESGLSSAMLDRLRLDDKRVTVMAQGLREVAALPDPTGRILDERIRPNGLPSRDDSTNFNSNLVRRNPISPCKPCLAPRPDRFVGR